MRFKLFGKLRGDDSGEDTGGNDMQGPPSDDTPLGGGSLDRTVESMFSQGYSEEEIKQELQGQYDPQEIERAVNNAVASSASGEKQGPEPMTPYQGEGGATSPVDEGYGVEEEDDLSPDTGMNETQESFQQPVDAGSPAEPGTVDSGAEELIETIVAENFDAVEQEFENVYSEIDEIRESMDELEQRVNDLEVRDDEDQQQFVQKVDEMEDHIDQYQSRIGGLEKAFQQVLPSLVDNVRDLTDLVQEIKAERGIETSRNVSSEDIQDIDMDEWDE